MALQRLEHVGVVVDDLPAATEFFLGLGLEIQSEGQAEGSWVDRIVGLDGVRADIAILRTPDGHGFLELTKFHAPAAVGGDQDAPANTPGLRHLAFFVEGIDELVADLQSRGTELVGEVVRYEDSYVLCYLRGPEGIIVELIEKVSSGTQ